MIDQIVSRENYVVAKKLLDVAHNRHQALAGNIANIETPGYQRNDIKAGFAERLQKAAKAGGATDIASVNGVIERDYTAKAVRPDGNNVQLDQELLKMNKNALQYEFLTHYTSNSLNRIKTAITGRIM